MKMIFKIAKTELQKLFYSPVAWLILIMLAFQFGIEFTERIAELMKGMGMGYERKLITWRLFANTSSPQGVYYKLLEYLYLYIPLLTMNSISRELSTGSIKLLYSSPVTNTQIILGKYFALAAFGLLMIAIPGVFGIYSMFAIDAADIPVILNGLFGIYLLICAYCAIGLFISSLTSYAVVAAMGTVAVLAMLNYVADVGQDTPFLRDITYWFSIKGRAENFIQGLIITEDLLYFIIVTVFFLSLSIIKLQSGRHPVSASVRFRKYALVTILSIGLGYLSSLPTLKGYLDVTHTKMNTLSKGSQKIMSRLQQPITINTYTNMLDKYTWLAIPSHYKYDVKRFEQYIRFKPDLKLNYTYYYHRTNYPDLDKRFPTATDEQRMDTLRKAYKWDFPIVPYKDLAATVNLSAEDYRFVRELVQADGQKTYLRIFDDIFILPDESQITAAFKRLAGGLPVVGFLTGHQERSSTSEHDQGYKKFAQEKTFRSSLINNGLIFEDVTLDHPIPESIHILVIAEIKTPLTELQLSHLNQYVQRGDNLLIAGEPGRQAYMNPVTEPFGVRFMDGQLVRPTSDWQQNLLILPLNEQAYSFSHYMEPVKKYDMKLPMLSATGLELQKDKGYNITTLFQSDSATWNELQTTNFIDDSARFNSDETKAVYPTVVALSKKINNKEQKILITGDADWLSNKELSFNRKDIYKANFELINAAFFWLSDGEGPSDTRRDPSLDNKLKISKTQWSVSSIMLKWVLPGILIVAGILISIRRRGR